MLICFGGRGGGATYCMSACKQVGKASGVSNKDGAKAFIFESALEGEETVLVIIQIKLQIFRQQQEKYNIVINAPPNSPPPPGQNVLLSLAVWRWRRHLICMNRNLHLTGVRCQDLIHDIN